MSQFTPNVTLSGKRYNGYLLTSFLYHSQPNTFSSMCHQHPSDQHFLEERISLCLCEKYRIRDMITYIAQNGK